MYCTVCGSNRVVSVTHFERNKNPTRYKVCQRCHSKSKEVTTDFGEMISVKQKALDAE